MSPEERGDFSARRVLFRFTLEPDGMSDICPEYVVVALDNPTEVMVWGRYIPEPWRDGFGPTWFANPPLRPVVAELLRRIGNL